MLRYNNNLVEFQGYLVSDNLVDRIADHLRGLKTRAEPLCLEPMTSGKQNGIVEAVAVADAQVAYPKGELPTLTEADWEALSPFSTLLCEVYKSCHY